MRLGAEYAATDGLLPPFATPAIELRGIPALRYQGNYVAVVEAEVTWQTRWNVVALGPKELKMNKSYKQYALFCLCIPFLVPGAALAQSSSQHARDAELAADEAIENCRQDIVRFCGDVNPGEGRILACLQAYNDQVLEQCRDWLERWHRPDPVQDYQSIRIYPTLEHRDLGDPNIGDDGKRVIWKHKLPLFAQKVIDLGFELPNPYGVAIIPARIRQDLTLQNLAIGINGPADRELDFVDFGIPSVENSALQLKLDAWVLPFLSVFTTVGVFDGDANIPLTFEGSDLFPDACSITPNAPFCVRTYSTVASPRYEGTNVSLGMTLAMGWDRFFAALPITYAWTDVDLINETVTALNISPRIGMTGDAGDRGTVAVFLGATYLRAEVDITGEFDLETPSGPVGEVTTVAFRVSQRNKDRWNALLGFNWEMNKIWSVMAEAGFGGSRESFIAGVTYRF